MDAQEQNFCLANMPVLVVEKILANIYNPSNVSQTCKYLYGVVCGMEKCRRVLLIRASNGTSPLNIDTDVVFESIMNSHRTINEIELRIDRSDDSLYELNEQQLQRLNAIMKRFGGNVTSLKFHGFLLPINFILELLQQTTKLESLSFTCGKVKGSITQNTTMSLQLPSLKSLEIEHFPGILDIVNLIPAGSLNQFSSYIDKSIESTNLTESTDILTTILTKQHNIKYLKLEVKSFSDLTVLCVDHLQLETLIVTSYSCGLDNVIKSLDILKCHKNLKELRFVQFITLSGSVFQWICNNLKKLEVFEVSGVQSIEGNVFEMLSELKQLRHFHTFYGDFLFDNEFQSSQFKSDSIEKFKIGFEPVFSCDEFLNKVVNSMAHNLPNLTHLQMNFENFSALCFVLSHCTQIIHLTSDISDLDPDQLAQQRFPSIQHLELTNYCNMDNDISDERMSRSMTPIARAMPNLKSMSLLTGALEFDVKTMKEFIKESKSLQYFYVDRFELHQELSADDVVESMLCLTDQLKGYRIHFSASTSPEDLNWHKIKDSLSIDFYVRDENWKRSVKCFYLFKGREEKFPSEF